MRPDWPSWENIRVHRSMSFHATGPGSGTTSSRPAAPPATEQAAVASTIRRSASWYSRPTLSPLISRDTAPPPSVPSELAM